MKRRAVYVAGELGARPLLLAYSLETAMVRLLNAHSVPKRREQSGYPEQWTCAFADAESEDVVWTLTLEEGGRTHALYIVKYEVEEDRRDPETGWRV